jgi:hypothetical protein
MVQLESEKYNSIRKIRLIHLHLNLIRSDLKKIQTNPRSR